MFLSSVLKEVWDKAWKETPATNVMAIFVVAGFFAWIIYALSVKGFAALFGLAIWIIVSTVAMQIGIGIDFDF